jgi:hypothetical protein
MLALVTVMGWYRTKRPMQLRSFYDLLVLITSDSSTRVLYLGCRRHLLAKRGGTCGEMSVNFAYRYLFILLGFVNSYHMVSTALLPLRTKTCIDRIYADVNGMSSAGSIHYTHVLIYGSCMFVVTYQRGQLM